MKARVVVFCITIFLAGIAAGWFGKSLRNETAALDLLSVPEVYQSTQYSCGASALQSVLAYWGIEVHEETLMKALGTTEQFGTSPDSILRVARSYGLRAEMRENLSIADVNSLLRRGIPAILDIQAWGEEQDVRRKNWNEDWENGHYVIALGSDDTNLYVEDPSLLGCRGFIPLKELQSRWRDYEGDPPHDSSKRSHISMVIIIEGTKRSFPTTFCRVD